MTRARRMPLVALVAAALCAISVLTGSAHAAFPDRPIRLIVSFPPGGASDGVARIVAEGLSYRLGVPVVVENQGGAAGTIAGAMVARAAPDGYTMLVSATAVFAMVPNLRKLDFDPLHDLLPVARIGKSLRALAVSPKLPVKTLADFIAYAKQNPGKLNYGSSGQGSTVHILTESTRPRRRHRHRPYSLSRRRAVARRPACGRHRDPDRHRRGPARPGRTPDRACRRRRRAPPRAPDLPTLAELGLSSVRTSGWTALFAPARLPPIFSMSTPATSRACSRTRRS